MSSEATPGATQRWTAPDPDARHAEFSTPLGAVASGRLFISSGASNVTLTVDPSMPDLIRARFKHPFPTVAVDRGTVTITYRRPRLGNLLSFRHEPAADLVLNVAIPWELEIRGGVSKLNAYLTDLRLSAFSIGGGVSRMEVMLPRPSGTIPIKIGGGVSNVTLRRPAEVPVRFSVGGGISGLTFDAQRFGAMGGNVRSESPDYANAADRYDIAISGGVSRVAITSPQ